MLEEKIKAGEDALQAISTLIKPGEVNYYPFMAAINALDINNEMMKELMKTMEGDASKSRCIQRLYCILQSLFVCIDALYTLNSVITNNKNYLNINQNRQLRELKYIRNDVVGHPASRVFDNQRIGCCVLKKDLVTKKEFKYYIYYEKETKARKVNIADLVEQYYDESTNLLLRLASFKAPNVEPLVADLKSVERMLSSDADVRSKLLDLRSKFISSHAYITKKNTRFIWRIELLIKLRQSVNGDRDFTELLNYCAGYQLCKLYDAIVPVGTGNEKDRIKNDMRMPKGLTQFYKMMEKNPRLEETVSFLKDMTHPLFSASLKKCMEYTQDDYPQAYSYLETIKQMAEGNDSDLVYCLGILLQKRDK